MRRNIFIVAVALILLVGIGVMVVVLVQRSPKLQNAVYTLTNTVPNPTNQATSTVPVNRSGLTENQAIKFVARNFTEQYGSYSNQNNGSNLIAAQAFAAASYKKVLQTQITLAQAARPNQAYFGVVAKALVFTTLAQSSTAAQMVVTTQQVVTSGTSSQTITKDLLVDLVKIDREWKVNAAVWK